MPRPGRPRGRVRSHYHLGITFGQTIRIQLVMEAPPPTCGELGVEELQELELDSKALAGSGWFDL